MSSLVNFILFIQCFEKLQALRSYQWILYQCINILTTKSELSRWRSVKPFCLVLSPGPDFYFCCWPPIHCKNSAAPFLPNWLIAQFNSQPPHLTVAGLYWNKKNRQEWVLQNACCKNDKLMRNEAKALEHQQNTAKQLVPSGTPRQLHNFVGCHDLNWMSGLLGIH